MAFKPTWTIESDVVGTRSFTTVNVPHCEVCDKVVQSRVKASGDAQFPPPGGRQIHTNSGMKTFCPEHGDWETVKQVYAEEGWRGVNHE